jgi:hypothetical protein
LKLDRKHALVTAAPKTLPDFNGLILHITGWRKLKTQGLGSTREQELVINSFTKLELSNAYTSEEEEKNPLTSKEKNKEYVKLSSFKKSDFLLWESV